MQLKVPFRINKNVRKLVKKVNSESLPKYIPVKLDINYNIESSFINVNNKISTDGGSIIKGWKIGEDPFYLEAKEYYIWRDPAGKLIDITPTNNNIRKILFLTDSTISEIKNDSKSIRINTTNNPLIDDFLTIFEAIDLLQAYFELDHEAELLIIKKNKKIYHYLINAKGLLSIMIINSKSNLKMDCFCGSGKSYEECHRHILLKICSDIKIN